MSPKMSLYFWSHHKMLLVRPTSIDNQKVSKTNENQIGFLFPKYVIKLNNSFNNKLNCNVRNTCVYSICYINSVFNDYYTILAIRAYFLCPFQLIPGGNLAS